MITYRRIRPDEGLKLRAIRLQALADSPTAFGSTLAETLSRPEQHWDARAAENAAGDTSIMAIAEDAGKWIGLVGGYREEFDGQPCVHLISMWVNPAYRCRQIGRRLVGEIVAWARERGVRRVILGVTEGNGPAISLYERCGFVMTGQAEPHPSQPALRELMMALEVGP